MLYAKRYADFTTVTCLRWIPILENDSNKEIITESMRYLSKEGMAVFYVFVIMETHFHLIWQIMGDHQLKKVQQVFLKYTAQMILWNMESVNSPLLPYVVVHKKDRKNQVWMRKSLSTSLWSPSVLTQKLNYIHNNPVKAGLCRYPEEYKYSSARFYICNDQDWDFLVHYEG